MTIDDPKVAVVTGASAGIGAATARMLAADGWRVVLGARRLDRIEALADELGGTAIALDVTDAASVERYIEAVGSCRLLVNNAGGAHGVEPLAEAVDDKWITMFETNVLGLMRMTRGLLPRLVASGDGHVVNVTSIAALQGYPGGSGYNAAKFGARGVTESLRQELLGQPVRVTEILPGLVETEFSVVRFDGDTDRAAQVYAGLQPLTGDDVAECIRWAVSLPSHVNIDSVVVKPRAQADAFRTHRGTT
jgi:NADP-dependent 3-hydroxy acid dehydrogenase YdfG